MLACDANKVTKLRYKQSNMTETLDKFNENKPKTDDNFIFPHKRKLIASSIAQPKRYVLDTSQLCENNKYQVLSDHSYATPSSDINDVEDMDDSTPEVQTNNPKSKVPPIFLHDANNHQEIIKDVKNVTKASFSTHVRGQSLKINLSNIDDYRSLTAFYDTSDIKYHTFQPIHDKKLQVVVRNVPTSLSDDEIKTELKDQNYPVIKVTRILNKNKLPLPLCAIDLENNDNGKAIFKLDTLCFAVVNVEPKRKSNQIPQCTRCQRFGHTKNFCKLDPRCVRCTGQHHYSECPKAKTESPQCINCGESHTANYRGCQLYQDIIKTKLQNKNSSGRLRNPTNVNETNNIPDLTSSSQFPNICNNIGSDQNSQPLRGSYAEAAANRPTAFDHSSASPELSKNNHSDSSVSTSLEQIILDIVKAFIPALKKVISNVISSVLSNGSV